METLFRFHLVRSPALPDPRYPAIKLAQDTPFQEKLATAATDPANPRSAMEGAANTYLSSTEFVDIAREEPQNMKLDAAATILDTRARLPVTDTTDPEVSRLELTAAITKALDQDFKAYADLVTTKSLLSRLKDTIVAIRQVHVESPGHMAILALRLRAIDFIQKMAADDNFPISQFDMSSWWQRTLLAPTLVELNSILSAAIARKAAFAKAMASLSASQKLANFHYQQNINIAATLKELKAIPNSFIRRTPIPVSIPAIKPDSSFSRDTFKMRHLQLLNTYADLSKKHYDLVLSGAADTTRISPALLSEGQISTDAVQEIAPTQALKKLPDASGLSSLVDMSKLIMAESKSLLADGGTQGFEPMDPKNMNSTLQEGAYEQLSGDARTLLKQHNLDITDRPLPQIIRTLEHEMSMHASALDALYTENDDQKEVSVSRVGNVLMRSTTSTPPRWQRAKYIGDTLAPIFRGLEQTYDLRIPHSKGKVTISGICDLLVVKQQLVGYEKADIAHIESVLLNEKKSYEVTNRQQVEQTTYTETETTTSLDTEKSSTERFETAAEAANTIKEDQAMKAGVTISASYGPFVSMTANAEGSQTRSKEESGKTATKFSKDITEKVSSKIQQRVLQRTTLKITTETIDKSMHEFNNKGGKANINGVYQYVTKVYEAQTWNYGKRTMLDFMLPEPGAFLFDGPGKPSIPTIDIPAVPTFALTPDQLDDTAAMYWAVTLGVTDIEPAPPSTDTVSYQYGQPSQQIDTSLAYSADIKLQPNFEVETIAFTFNCHRHYENASATVVIGNFSAPIACEKGTDYHSSPGEKQRTTIPVTITTYELSSWAISVDITLKGTPEAQKAWQLATWNKITAQRAKLQADYEAKVAAIKTAAAAEAYNNPVTNPGFKGINPAFNQAIMRDEVKKMCISVITDQQFEGFGAIDQPSGFSQINILQAASEGPYVKFFEEAFEWDQMTWTTYPYFWGRKDHWFRRIAYDDPDPIFRDFMRAGYARANVPIRQGFEGAIDHFLSTGQVWMGGSLPGIGSDLFLPISTEIEEDLGKKAGVEERYGEPWLVRIPTSLVTLRRDDALPVWTKQSDGTWLEGDDLPKTGAGTGTGTGTGTGGTGPSP